MCSVLLNILVIVTVQFIKICSIPRWNSESNMAIGIAVLSVVSVGMEKDALF